MKTQDEVRYSGSHFDVHEWVVFMINCGRGWKIKSFSLACVLNNVYEAVLVRNI